MSTTTLYVLRHCHPADGEFANRARPLSDRGRHQAQALIPYLKALGIDAVYSSPFSRALETVRPFCEAAGLSPAHREDLGESAAEELLPQVRDRMVAATRSIAPQHPGQTVLLCTHGGTMWGLISHFDEAFGYEQYCQIGTPDMRRLIYSGTPGALDDDFSFDLAPG